MDPGNWSAFFGFGANIVVNMLTLTALLAAVAVFVIDHEFLTASAFALSAAAFACFGFMHGPAVGTGNGLGVTPGMAVAYLIAAGFLFMLSRNPELMAARREVLAE